MKRIVIIAIVISALAATWVRSSTLDCTADASYSGNMETVVSGYLYASAWKQGTDTTYIADTASIPLDVSGCRRIAIEYQWQLRNAFCAASTFDSVKARNVYVCWHSDTVVVRAYRWLQIIGYPSRSQVAIEDSAGSGITETNAIPSNAYYRRLFWQFTPFLIDKGK